MSDDNTGAFLLDLLAKDSQLDDLREGCMRPSIRFGILLAAAVLSATCDSIQPTQPTPVASNPLPPAPAPPPPSLVTQVFKGDVLDENDQPVSAAGLRFYDGHRSIDVLSDADGRFEVALELRSGSVQTGVSAQKSGYEPSDTIVDARTSGLVRLYSIYRLTAGDTAQLSITGGAYCGLEFEYECRRVRIRSASTGMLTVEATPGDFKLIMGPLRYPDTSTSRLSVQVQAGTETAIDVLTWLYPEQPKSFTLRSSVSPN